MLHKFHFTYKGCVYRLEIWESNKGALGACSWGLWEAVKPGGHWYKHVGTARYFPVSYGRARQDATRALLDLRCGVILPISSTLSR
jgi:hypothetical protein